MYHLSLAILAPTTPHPDRFSPRELTLIELHNIGVENTIEHILPGSCCNDDSLPVTQYPIEYPLYRTDFYTQTTLQLNTHHNQRSNQLLQMRDLLDIPFERYADINPEVGGNQFKESWDQARRNESVSMTFQDKWYTAARIVAPADA
ncbi:uncharacterized protein L199_006839 [Kwoniella botswanensis]|uniref:uncharacterized protein n=1 Tax=Kwoniella botswanensis TaxID=1268659 RepID=UPI00315D21DC